jgi:hypothetical protein
MGLSTAQWSRLPQPDAALAAAAEFLVAGGETQAAALLKL